MLWRLGRLTCLRQASQRVRQTQPGHSASDPSRNPPFRPLSDTRNLDVELKKHSTLLRDGSLTTNDRTIRIAGLVRSIRKQKKVAFAHISDGTTLQPIQAILTPDQAQRIQNGAYVELTGEWTESQGRGQSHELRVDQVGFIGESDPEISPIQKKIMTAEHLRNHLHLRLRTPQYSLLARARAQLISAAHIFYSGQDNPEDAALFVQPPLITSSDCEGAGEVFTIAPKLHSPPAPATISLSSRDGATEMVKEAAKAQKPYFGSPKYLTVSSQLHLEAYSAELGDVWTLSPTFRAEESDTPRHLAEFYMLEAEFRSVTTIEEITHKAQRLVQFLASSLAHSPTGTELLAYQSDPRFTSPEDRATTNLEGRWKTLSHTPEPWPHMTYADAISALKAAAESSTNPTPFQHPPTYETGLQLEHERWLVSHIPTNNTPLFITHYPQHLKPFYMLSTTKPTSTDNHADKTAACFDLLLPHGTCELIGGSLREHRLGSLLANMHESGLLKAHTQQRDADVDGDGDGNGIGNRTRGQSEALAHDGGLQWYTDLRRFGTSPHGGFGMGFDRLLMYLTGVGNVRDVVAFPRTWGRADC